MTGRLILNGVDVGEYLDMRGDQLIPLQTVGGHFWYITKGRELRVDRTLQVEQLRDPLGDNEVLLRHLTGSGANLTTTWYRATILERGSFRRALQEAS